MNPKMGTQPSDIAVVMVPLPMQSHLNQLLHLSQLITSYKIPVHFAGSSSHNRQAKQRLQGWDLESLSNIHFHDFQLPPYNSAPSKPDPSVPFPSHCQPLFEAATHLRQPVSRLIQELADKFRRVIVIHDALMSFVVQDVKLVSNAEAYTFMASCAFYFFLNMWASFPDNDKPFQLESNDIIPEKIPSEEGCFTQEVVEFGAKQFQCLGFESGWIYNTSRVVEGKYVDLLEKLCPTKKLICVGPLNPINVKSNKTIEGRHDCLKWLDEQEKDSVIYVSFGSTTSLIDEQIEELANGLEKSGVRFIWVLRNADPNDVFAEADKVKRPQIFAGYEERIKDRGIIVRDWAPQLEILAHSSVGGFMSHCGWNSCIESISMGVPIAAWPIHSEQPRNAVFVSQVLRVGVMVRDWEQRGEIVRSSVIENVVKKLMVCDEGKEMQRRVKELGEAVRVSIEEGGVSSLERDSFIAHISR